VDGGTRIFNIRNCINTIGDASDVEKGGRIIVTAY